MSTVAFDFASIPLIAFNTYTNTITILLFQAERKPKQKMHINLYIILKPLKIDFEIKYDNKINKLV